MIVGVRVGRGPVTGFQRPWVFEPGELTLRTRDRDPGFSPDVSDKVLVTS